jgi:hypothetical protein
MSVLLNIDWLFDLAFLLSGLLSDFQKRDGELYAQKANMLSDPCCLAFQTKRSGPAIPITLCTAKHFPYGRPTKLL